MWRVDLGFVVSALGLPIAVIIGSGFAPGGLIYALFIAAFTITATAFVGVPVYRWCRYRICLAVWPFLAGGLVAGAVFSLPLSLLLGEPEGILRMSGAFAIIGGIHATVFWLVAIFRNAALDESPPIRNA